MNTIFEVNIEAASTTNEVNVTVSNGPKGDPFRYEDFTPEQIADLKQPAIDAAVVANNAADAANQAAENVPVIEAISPTDPEPTKNGMYIPTVTQNEAGTPIVYANAGGLTVNTAEGGEDYGKAPHLIKNGGIWVKVGVEMPMQDLSGLSPEIISGNWFSIEGMYISMNNGNIVATATPNAITGYIDISNVEQIIIRGRSTSLVALGAFYNENKGWISSIGGAGYNNVLTTINKEDFPSGAKFFIGNGNNNDKDILFVYSLKSAYESHIEHEDRIESLETDVSEIIDYSSNILDLSSSLTLAGYYRRRTDPLRYDLAGLGSEYVASSPIEVKVGDKFTTSSSIVSGPTGASIHVIMDSDKSIIGPLLTSSGYVITQEMWDDGVRFVAFSYRPEDEKSLTLKRIGSFASLANEVQDHKVRIEILESESHENPIGNISGIAAMGASLMYSGNSWFADACNILSVEAFNYAESGVGSPVYFANKIWRGEYCTDEEFEQMDILAIQFASSSSLDRTTDLLPTADDYTLGFDINNPANPFTTYHPSQQLDYILKHWQQRCFEQKDNPNSKWFNTPHGKPFRVIFVTHWHDARPYYSDAIRLVADRWGAGVCDFDKKIGFSKNQSLQDGSQVSIIYAVDTESIDDVVYGWHPLRGVSGDYIQRKMANIFANSIVNFFSLK